HESGSDPQLTGAAGTSSKPTPRGRQPAAGFRGSIGNPDARIQQERRDSSIAQLPDRPVQNKVVNVHERSEDQEATREVVVEQAACQPRSRNKQSDAAGDQHSEISPWTPVPAALARGLAPGIVARNPEILRRMHHS